MINPRHLASLTAIAEAGSFSGAGIALGRSHSAISLHIKALEEELDTLLVDRSVRPPALTPEGAAIAEHAARVAEILEEIESIGRRATLSGRLAVGIVPTALTELAPPALVRLRGDHPELRIDIRAGLSGELAQAVRGSELDAALLTARDLPPEGLVQHIVAHEPLVVIAPSDAQETTDAELISAHPFIWFSRKTWAGQQIERMLAERRIAVRAAMEVDSLEAVEALVRHGLGVSVVPSSGRRAERLRSIAFGAPQKIRRLALVARARTPKSRLVDALLDALIRVAQENASTQQIGANET